MSDNKRQFEDVLNEWVNEVLLENSKAKEPETILLLMRLGTLAQRLLLESHQIGMDRVVAMMREQRDGELQIGTLDGLPITNYSSDQRTGCWHAPAHAREECPDWRE